MWAGEREPGVPAPAPPALGVGWRETAGELPVAAEEAPEWFAVCAAELLASSVVDEVGGLDAVLASDSDGRRLQTQLGQLSTHGSAV